MPLLGRRPREPLGAARQDVLLDHQPAAERDPAQAVQHGVGVQVAAAQRAERLPGPDLGHRRLVRDDLGHDRQPGVLEVHVVDPVAQVAQHGHRVAAAEQHVPGLQAQPDVGHLEHALDLPRRLDVGAGLRVEGRLVAPVTAAVDHPGQAGREPSPRVGVEPERGVPDRTPGPVPPRLAARLSERRPRRRAGEIGPDGVEHGQDGVQFGQRPLQRVVVGVRQLHVGAGQAEAALGQQFAEPLAAAQVADRAEVDARVPGRGHLVQDRDAVGHVGVVADGQLEGPVADRGVRHRDVRAHPVVPPASIAVPSALAPAAPAPAAASVGWSTGADRW